MILRLKKPDLSAIVIIRWIIGLALVLLLLLQYPLWFGDSGYKKYVLIQQEIKEQQQIISELSERNKHLGLEVASLKPNGEGLVENIREKLGMIGPSETFFRLVEPETESDDE